MKTQQLTVEEFVKRMQEVIQQEARGKSGLDAVVLAVMIKVLHLTMRPDGEATEEAKPPAVWGAPPGIRRDPSRSSHYYMENGKMHHTDENWDPRYGCVSEDKANG
jgi:hypothetical protein